MTRRADVVICGAGIAGVATAYELVVHHGVRNVVLVDERAPLSLTSDKSTEAYRNWWPGPDDAMVRFMNRSIDKLEAMALATDNRFLMNRRGYVYATTSPATAERFVVDAARAELQGAGVVRTYHSANDALQYMPSAHTGFVDHPSGADLFLDADAIRQHFPFLANDIVAVLHARRCGWLSGQQLGAFLLEQAKAGGASVITGVVRDVRREGNRVRAVHVDDAAGVSQSLSTDVFVNAAGPFARSVGALSGVEIPLFSELHLKVAFEDTHGAVDRNTGLVILDDAQTLRWPDEVRDELANDDDTRWLTEPMPAGVHMRPEGYHASQTVLLLWDYHSTHRFDAPVFPIPEDPLYPELALRGLTRLAPKLAAYLDAIPRSYVDGGYYTKTVENRPLIGPTPVEGAYVNVGHSGFGLMAAPAAGELLAAHITGATLPDYASAFALQRYDDTTYQQRLKDWGSTGQL